MLILPPVVLRASVVQDASQAAPARARTCRRDGGKAPAAALLRPVKASSKRGRMLTLFLRGATVADAMTQFACSREAVFACWTALRRDHGVGYAFDAASGVIAPKLPEGISEAALWL